MPVTRVNHLYAFSRRSVNLVRPNVVRQLCIRQYSATIPPNKALSFRPKPSSCLPYYAYRPAVQRTRNASTTADASLRKTPLYDLHVSRGGKMVPFGGFYMPVQYNDLGVGESHVWTRTKASIFDVSHMYVLIMTHFMILC